MLSRPKTYLNALAILGVATCLAAPAYAQDCALEGTRLDINAQATVKAEPDIAMLNAAVVTIAPTAEQARLENAKKMQAVFAQFKGLKIAEKDIQTSGLNVNPQYVYAEKQAPRIDGYQATNNITLKLRDMDNVSKAVDVLIKNGINQLNGPSFTIDDPEVLMNKARQTAMQKARQRAELYASATGLKIRRIVSISENANMGQPIPYRAMAKMAMAAESADAATPIASGQVDLDVTVNVTYELAN